MFRISSPAQHGSAGHAVIDEAMKRAGEYSGCTTPLPHELWPNALFVFRVNDRITTTGAIVRSVVCGVLVESDQLRLVRDWEVLRNLNSVLEKRNLRRDEDPFRSDFADDHPRLAGAASDFVQ